MNNYLRYAIDEKENILVHIDDVANGLECGCLCPHCRQRLVAKNEGTQRNIILHTTAGRIAQGHE